MRSMWRVHFFFFRRRQALQTGDHYGMVLQIIIATEPRKFVGQELMPSEFLGFHDSICLATRFSLEKVKEWFVDFCAI